MDNEWQWAHDANYYRDDKDMSRAVVTFIHNMIECDKCLGNGKIDNYDMIVHGIKDIKWKTTAEACIQGAKHAFVGCKNDPWWIESEHVAKCAAWQKLDTKLNLKKCPKK